MSGTALRFAGKFLGEFGAVFRAHVEGLSARVATVARAEAGHVSRQAAVEAAERQAMMRMAAKRAQVSPAQAQRAFGAQPARRLHPSAAGGARSRFPFRVQPVRGSHSGAGRKTEKTGFGIPPWMNTKVGAATVTATALGVTASAAYAVSRKSTPTELSKAQRAFIDALQVEMPGIPIIFGDTNTLPWRSPFRPDARGPGRLLAVVQPRNFEELDQYLAFARKYGVQNINLGSMTGLKPFNYTYEHNVVGVSLRNMRTVLYVEDDDDAFIVAEAGATTNEINAVAREHGLSAVYSLGSDRISRVGDGVLGPSVGAAHVLDSGGTCVRSFGGATKTAISRLGNGAIHDEVSADNLTTAEFMQKLHDRTLTKADVNPRFRGKALAEQHRRHAEALYDGSLVPHNGLPEDPHSLAGSQGEFGTVSAVVLYAQPMPHKETTFIVSGPGGYTVVHKLFEEAIIGNGIKPIYAEVANGSLVETISQQRGELVIGAQLLTPPTVLNMMLRMQNFLRSKYPEFEKAAETFAAQVFHYTVAYFLSQVDRPLLLPGYDTPREPDDYVAIITVADPTPKATQIAKFQRALAEFQTTHPGCQVYVCKPGQEKRAHAWRDGAAIYTRKAGAQLNLDFAAERHLLPSLLSRFQSALNKEFPKHGAELNLYAHQIRGTIHCDIIGKNQRFEPEEIKRIEAMLYEMCDGVRTHYNAEHGYTKLPKEKHRELILRQLCLGAGGSGNNFVTAPFLKDLNNQHGPVEITPSDIDAFFAGSVKKFVVFGEDGKQLDETQTRAFLVEQAMEAYAQHPQVARPDEAKEERSSVHAARFFSYGGDGGADTPCLPEQTPRPTW